MNDDREDWLKRRAYAIWQTELCPDGRHREHWEQAEREFLAAQATKQNGATSDSAAEAVSAGNGTKGRRAPRKTTALTGSSGKKKSTELRP